MSDPLYLRMNWSEGLALQLRGSLDVPRLLVGVVRDLKRSVVELTNTRAYHLILG